MPNNIVLLITIDKSNPNPMLVNINKLKPYKFIEDKTLQPILTKPSDLVTDEPIQSKELEPLHVEPEDLQPVESELVNNALTHNNIKGTYVPSHYYHDVLIQDNDAIVYNDQNDAFSEALINVYILKVYNPKGRVYSQPHNCY